MLAELFACGFEDWRDLLELLADNAETEIHPGRLQAPDRIEECFGVLVVLPSCGPENSKRAVGSRASRRELVYAGVHDSAGVAYSPNCVWQLVVRHGTQQFTQGAEEFVAMVFGVEPRLRRQRRYHVRQAEVHVSLVFSIVGIRELVFVEVGDSRKCSHAGRRESEEFRQVQHVAAEDRIESPAGARKLGDSIGKCYRSVPHSPFPLVGRQ